MNDALANFCSRCGAQVASPVESPSDSQVFSVDSTALLPEQMQRLSLTEAVAKPWSNGPVSSFTPEPAAFPGAMPSAAVSMTAAAAVASNRSPSSAPVAPLGDRKPHPVFCFGLGGAFALTFPSLQTRYNPAGQPINSFRPGMVYCGAVPGLSEARSRLTESLTCLNEGAPLLELASRPKDLMALLQRLRATAGPEEGSLLYGLFGLMLQYNDRIPLDNPKALEQLRALLKPFMTPSASVPTSSTPSTASLGALCEAVTAGSLDSALQGALEAGLWSHALVLGQALGAPHLQQAVSAFVKAGLPPCHPLRLAYLQLSGQSVGTHGHPRVVY